MNNLPLKSKLMLWIMPIIILGLLSLCFVAYKSINVVIETELSSSMLISVGKSAGSIDRWLKTIMLEPEAIASTPLSKSINEDFYNFDRQNINRYKTLQERHPNVFHEIYAANRKGEYHTILKNGDEFSIFVGDISNRPYFKSIMTGGPTQITPPLLSRTTGKPVVFIVAPILDDNNTPHGLVGAGISFNYIQQIAQELKVGKSGYGFILAQDGRFISHPEADLVMNKKITELESPSTCQLGNLMVSGGSGIYCFSQRGQKMIAFYQPIPISNWSVATVLPEAELFAPANKMMKQLMTVAFVFVYLIGTAIFVAMAKLTDPLQLLVLKTKQIASGNLKGISLEINANDEIGILSKCFNEMVNNLAREKEETEILIDQLKESEALFRSQFESGSMGISIFRNDQAFHANAQLCRMLGYSAEELHKKRWDELIASPDFEEGMVSFNRILAGEIDSYEKDIRMVNKEGGIVYTIFRISCFRDTDRSIRFVIISILDITDRKQAELALRESEARFKALHNASFGGIGIHDKGRIIDCNQGLSDLTGYSISELIGMDGVLLLSEKTRNFVRKNIQSGYEKSYEAIGVRKNGEEYPIRLEAKNIPYKGKRVRVTEFRDITEQKLAEKMHDKLRSQLVQAQKMEAIGVLAGGIAHDFNNILSVIMGFIDLAKLNAGNKEKNLRYLEKVASAALRARDLVSQILAFSRKTDSEKQLIDINPIIKETIKFMRASLPANIEIKQDLKIRKSRILGDATHIHQIFMNLFTNSGHAMKEKGGVLSVTQDVITIKNDEGTDCKEIAPGKYLKICVSDTGCGIPRVVKDRVFEPFFTTKERGEGTGMGLSTVYGIVKEMGGNITIDSEEGMGTTINIMLPEAQAEFGGSESAFNAPLITGGGNILVVDDEASIVESTHEILSSLGYDVTGMTNSIEALEKIETDPNHFDLILTDLSMPEMSGLALSKKIKVLNPDVPIILCTGFNQGVTEEVFKAAGILEMAMKPLIAGELSKMVYNALKG